MEHADIIIESGYKFTSIPEEPEVLRRVEAAAAKLEKSSLPQGGVLVPGLTYVELTNILAAASVYLREHAELDGPAVNP